MELETEPIELDIEGASSSAARPADVFDRARNLTLRCARFVDFALLRVIGPEGFILGSALLVSLWLTQHMGYEYVLHINGAFTTFMFILLHIIPPAAVCSLVIHLYRSREELGLTKAVTLAQFRRVMSTSAFTMANLLTLVHVLAVKYYFTPAYSNAKPLIPLYNSKLYDDILLKLDKFVCFGHDPYTLFASYRPDWLLNVMQFGYVAYFYMFLATLTLLFLKRRQLALRVFILAFMLATISGEIIAFLMPSLGDCFVAGREHLYSNVPDWTMVRGWQLSLWKGRMELLTTGAWNPGISGGVAAFPSIHCAHCTIYLFLVQRYARSFLWFYVPLALILYVSTIWFGWHYISDAVAGIGLGYGCLFVARKLVASSAIHLRRGWLTRFIGD